MKNRIRLINLVSGILGVVVGVVMDTATIHRLIEEMSWERSIHEQSHAVYFPAPQTDWFSFALGCTFGTAFFIVGLLIVIQEIRQWRGTKRKLH